MAKRRLIINADDFGLTSGINRGIAEAIADGVVTSASVIVNMPGWEDAAERLRSGPRDASYGLHLNLVAGRPLTSAPSLVNNSTGYFHSLPRFVYLAMTGALRAGDIAAECAAQLVRLRATGITVSHADSHRHVHALPLVARAISPIVGELLLRRPREALTRNPGDLSATTKKLVLSLSQRRLGRCIPHHGFVDHFVGISLQGSRRFAERLARLVDTLPAGTTELMVHPGYVDEALVAVDSYTVQRERELAALLSPAFRFQLARRRIQLVRFGAPASTAMTPDAVQ